MHEPQAGGLFASLRGISETLSEAIAIADEIVEPVPGKTDEGITSRSGSILAEIGVQVEAIQNEANYLLDRLAEIRRQLQ